MSGLVISPEVWRSAKQIHDMTKGTNLVIINTDEFGFAFPAKPLRDFMHAGLHAKDIEYQMDIEEAAIDAGHWRKTTRKALVIRYRGNGLKGQARFFEEGGMQYYSSTKTAKLFAKEPLRLWFESKEEAAAEA